MFALSMPPWTSLKPGIPVSAGWFGEGVLSDSVFDDGCVHIVGLVARDRNSLLISSAALTKSCSSPLEISILSSVLFSRQSYAVKMNSSIF